MDSGRDQALRASVTAVADGELKIREAARRFKIPRSTIGRHIKAEDEGRKLRKGRRSALTEGENEVLVQTVVSVADMGTPVTDRKVKEFVNLVTETDTSGRRRFKNSKPSAKWLKTFRQKNKDAIRFARPLVQENERVRAMNSESVPHHYATLQKLVKENRITVDRMFNVDEMVMSPERDFAKGLRQRCLLPRRGRSATADQRLVEFVYENHVTCMPVVASSGELGPILVVIKVTILPYRVAIRNGEEIVETPACLLPRRAVIAMHKERGGVESDNFLSWAKVFTDYVRDLTVDGGKLLLTDDGYRAHLFVQVLNLFRENNEIAYKLPSHTSGKLQPLDVTVFSSLKGHLRHTANECVTIESARRLDMFDFCTIFGHSCRLALTQKVIMSGFRRSGLWPLNPYAILNRPLPASVACDNTVLLTVAELRAGFEARCQQLRNAILGSDSVIASCGFIDTANGCVMTIDRAFQLSVEIISKTVRNRRLKRASDSRKSFWTLKRNGNARHFQ